MQNNNISVAELVEDIQEKFNQTSFYSLSKYAEQMKQPVIDLLQEKLSIKINDNILDSKAFKALLGGSGKQANVNADKVIDFLKSEAVQTQDSAIVKALNAEIEEEEIDVEDNEKEEALSDIEKQKEEVKSDVFNSLTEEKDEDIEQGGEAINKKPLNPLVKAVLEGIIGVGTVDSFNNKEIAKGIGKLTIGTIVPIAAGIALAILLGPAGLAVALGIGAYTAFGLNAIIKQIPTINKTINGRAREAFTKSFDKIMALNPELKQEYENALESEKEKLRNQKNAAKRNVLDPVALLKINKTYNEAKKNLESHIKMKFIVEKKIKYTDSYGKEGTGSILKVIQSELGTKLSDNEITAFNKQLLENKLGQKNDNLFEKVGKSLVGDFDAQKHNDNVKKREELFINIDEVKEIVKNQVVKTTLFDTQIKPYDLKIPKPSEEYAKLKLQEEAKLEAEKMQKISEKAKKKLEGQSAKQKKQKQNKKNVQGQG